MQEATITQKGEPRQLTTDDLLLLIGQKEVMLLNQMRLTKAQVDIIAEAKARQAQAEKKSAELQSSLDGLSKKNRELDRALTELRAEIKQYKSMEAEKEWALKETASARERINELTKRNQEIAKTAKDIKDLESKVEEQAREIEALKAEIQSLTHANASLSGRLKKAQARLKDGKHDKGKKRD